MLSQRRGTSQPAPVQARRESRLRHEPVRPTRAGLRRNRVAVRNPLRPLASAIAYLRPGAPLRQPRSRTTRRSISVPSMDETPEIGLGTHSQIRMVCFGRSAITHAARALLVRGARVRAFSVALGEVAAAAEKSAADACAESALALSAMSKAVKARTAAAAAVIRETRRVNMTSPHLKDVRSARR